jgi:hypothetical protein
MNFFLKRGNKKLCRVVNPVSGSSFPGIRAVHAVKIPQKKWAQYHENHNLTLEKQPIFSKQDKIFTIGSCFAERIRIALTERGFDVGPDYSSIPMDDNRYRIDTLPSRPHMNYYNTFTIRQEMERHVGEWTQSENDYWVSKDKFWGGNQSYQDPYRRLVFGRTPGDLMEALGHINRVMYKGLLSSSVFFMTFGMAEVFKKKDNGMIACQKPAYGGGAGLKETEYHMSTFAENKANIKKTIAIIKSLNPSAKIVLTVSPVPLERSFGPQDVFISNTEGKSILRAAAGEVAREQEGVWYFPSYEIVTSNGVNGFVPRDGRHVNTDVVSIIVNGFIQVHCKG